MGKQKCPQNIFPLKVSASHKNDLFLWEIFFESYIIHIFCSSHFRITLVLYSYVSINYKAFFIFQNVRYLVPTMGKGGFWSMTSLIFSLLWLKDTSVYRYSCSSSSMENWSRISHRCKNLNLLQSLLHRCVTDTQLFSS